HEASQNRIAVGRELDELEAAVRTTQRAAEERLAAAAAAEAGVAPAEENIRIRRQQFDAGRATSDDVLDAEALLAGPRATRAAAATGSGGASSAWARGNRARPRGAPSAGRRSRRRTWPSGPSSARRRWSRPAPARRSSSTTRVRAATRRAARSTAPATCSSAR